MTHTSTIQGHHRSDDGAPATVIQPRLDISAGTRYDAYIRAAFNQVRHLTDIRLAKERLYPGRRPEGLLIGGNRSEIYFTTAEARLRIATITFTACGSCS